MAKNLFDIIAILNFLKGLDIHKYAKVEPYAMLRLFRNMESLSLSLYIPFVFVHTKYYDSCFFGFFFNSGLDRL